MEKEKKISSSKIYKGIAVDFCVDKVLLPNKKKAIREYIVHPGASAVLPILPDGRVALVKQFRYPVKKFLLEIPAGKLDKGESPITCAKRELLEETGFTAKKLKLLTTYHPTCAFSTEKITIFAAQNLKKIKKLNLDGDEFLEVKILKFSDAIKLVKSGKITDSKTIIALLLWEAFRLR